MTPAPALPLPILPWRPVPVAPPVFPQGPLPVHAVGFAALVSTSSTLMEFKVMPPQLQPQSQSQPQPQPELAIGANRAAEIDNAISDVASETVAPTPTLKLSLSPTGSPTVSPTASPIQTPIQTQTLALPVPVARPELRFQKIFRHPEPVFEKAAAIASPAQASDHIGPTARPAAALVLGKVYEQPEFATTPEAATPLLADERIVDPGTNTGDILAAADPQNSEIVAEYRPVAVPPPIAPTAMQIRSEPAPILLRVAVSAQSEKTGKAAPTAGRDVWIGMALEQPVPVTQQKELPVPAPPGAVFETVLSRSVAGEGSTAMMSLPAPPLSFELPADTIGRTSANAIIVVAERALDVLRGDVWFDQLARDIVAAKDDGKDLSFRLFPARLGQLDVQLQTRDDGLRLNFTTQSEEAAQVIAAAQPRLHDELRAQGVRISGAESWSNQNASTNAGGNQTQHRPPATPLSIFQKPEEAKATTPQSGRFA